MQEKSLRTSDLERLAGLKISSVRNILLGKTKHPKAETLQAIAEVLGCSVPDLLGKDPSSQKDTFSSPNLEHPQLLLESLRSFLSLFEQEGGTFSLDQAWHIIKEAYLYSSQNGTKKIDDRFIKWLFSKQKQP